MGIKIVPVPKKQSGGKKQSRGRALSDEDKRVMTSGLTEQQKKDAEMLAESKLGKKHFSKLMQRAGKSSLSEARTLIRRYAGLGEQIQEVEQRLRALQKKVEKEASGGRAISPDDITSFKEYIKKYRKGVDQDLSLLGEYGSKAVRSRGYKRRPPMPKARFSKKKYAYGGRVAKYKDG
mgnify:CR=1 FL=1